MAAELKPYSAYKDSGVPWLGEVPAHWEVRRLKTLCTMESGDSITAISIDPVGAYPVYGGNGMRGYTSNYTHDGNFVLIGRQGALCGNVHIVRGRFWASEHAVVATAHSGYSPGWLGATLGVMNLNQYSIAAAQPGLSVERVLNLQLPVPPLPEQTAIVRFLDHADRRIRRYIRAKQKLIALLEEQKQAIIHQAVTGQIDVRTGQPYPAYKPSGVEWLEDVPAHWEVRRTKSLFRLRTEKSGVAHGRELLSIYTHIGVRPRKDLEEKGNKASTTDDYWIVKRGDLIANKLLAWMGAIGVSHYDGVTSPAYDILMPIADLVSDYYHHLFRTRVYLQQFKQRSRGIMDMRLRLYFDQFGQIPIPVPPVDEQRAIVNFYNEATVNTDRVINQTRRQIDLLQEYRTRLIADVVTGKLDVREAAAALPEVDLLAVEDELGNTHAAPEVLPMSQ